MQLKLDIGGSFIMKLDTKSSEVCLKSHPQDFGVFKLTLPSKANPFELNYHHKSKLGREVKDPISHSLMSLI